MNNSELVWHYTKMAFLSDIQSTGKLIPFSERESNDKHYKRKGLIFSTTPFIWFSSNQDWEYSVDQLSGPIWMTWQQIANERKAIRFGISKNDFRLKNWNETLSISGNRRERRLREGLVKQQKKRGSDVSAWFTSTDSITLDELRFQIWFNGEWIDDIEF